MKFLSLTPKRKRIIKIVITCIALLTVISSIYRSFQLEYIYGLPENEVFYHLDKYSTSSIDSNTDHNFSSNFWWFSGACPIGSFYLPQEQVCTVSVRQYIGDIKIFFFSQEGKPTVWKSADNTSIPLASGSYKVYCIGKHFFGSVEIDLPLQR